MGDRGVYAPSDDAAAVGRYLADGMGVRVTLRPGGAPPDGWTGPELTRIVVEGETPTRANIVILRADAGVAGRLALPLAPDGEPLHGATFFAPELLKDPRLANLPSDLLRDLSSEVPGWTVILYRPMDANCVSAWQKFYEVTATGAQQTALNVAHELKTHALRADASRPFLHVPSSNAPSSATPGAFPYLSLEDEAVDEARRRRFSTNRPDQRGPGGRRNGAPANEREQSAPAPPPRSDRGTDGKGRDPGPGFDTTRISAAQRGLTGEEPARGSADRGTAARGLPDDATIPAASGVRRSPGAPGLRARDVEPRWSDTTSSSPRGGGASPGDRGGDGRGDALRLLLPTRSPLFTTVTPRDAGERLRGLFVEDPLFTAALRRIERAVPRRSKMCFGAALPAPGGRAILGGWNLDECAPVDSVAKLAILYAVFQLRSDVAVIGSTPGLADTGSSDERVRALEQAVANAFRQAPYAATRELAAPAKLPRLARLFDVKAFVELPSRDRKPDALELASGERVMRGADDRPTRARLGAALEASENADATSLIADVGLPYIGALLETSGLAYVSPQDRGLWLAWPYGEWPKRAQGSSPPITALGKTRNLTLRARAARSDSGQAGTVRAISAMLLLLHRGELVSAEASREMLELMARGGRLASALPDDRANCHSKVGIDNAWLRYSDAALMETASAPEPTEGAPTSSERPSRRPLAWSAVGLGLVMDKPDENEATRFLGKLGLEAKQAVEALAQRVAR